MNLLPHHAKMLADSAISREVIESRGYYSTTSAAELAGLGFSPAQRRVPALVVPIRIVTGEVGMHVIRPDDPRTELKSDGTSRAMKYEFPAGAHMRLDVPAAVRPQLANPAVPLWVTEGSKKADSAVSHGLCCVSVIGVWNWRGKNDYDGVTALADWESIALNGRDVYIVFDSDVMLKRSVALALSRLKPFLSLRKAHVKLVYLPSKQNSTKNGLDDYLAGGKTVDDLLALATTELREIPSDSIPNSTDLGNAQRLVARFGDRIRYVAPAGRWFIYDGSRWVRDETNAMQGLVKKTIQGLFKEAAKINDPERRKAAFKQAMASESARAIKAMVQLAQGEDGMAVLPSVFDTDPWLLTVANGTLDLRSGDLRPHNAGDLITKATPIHYDPDADCPRWLAFLESIFAEKSELIKFVQRAVGYSLTGSIREQVVFFLYGTGANGKSTFLDVFRALVGDYGQTADFSSFIEKDKEVVRNDLADLAGSRLVTAAETKQGQRLDEAVIKKLTGGDPIKARFLFREHFTYSPTFKLWLATNHRPVIRGGEHAIWRRIRLVPFEVTFEPAQQDPELANKLREELPGILAWAVRGCLDWQQNGLASPAIVQAATEEYREEMDTVAVFKKEKLVEEAGKEITSKALYEAYCSWAQENGETPQEMRWFGRHLNDKGLKSYKKGGVKIYRNLTLRLNDPNKVTQSGLMDSMDSSPNKHTHARADVKALRKESQESNESWYADHPELGEEPKGEVDRGAA
jgi:P4 family phage/plasmid primase-like protien